MGSDAGSYGSRLPGRIFQSTLPGWGATHAKSFDFKRLCNFNPRSPDGERLYYTYVDKWFHVFQSTLPGWGATRAPHIRFLHLPISIHAPRMGSDTRGRARQVWATDFNPRSPDGERQVNLGRIVTGGEFQSTLPGWGATIIPCGFSYHGAISIHAPRMGSDRITADSG